MKWSSLLTPPRAITDEQNLPWYTVNMSFVFVFLNTSMLESYLIKNIHNVNLFGTLKQISNNYIVW